ncbi:kinase-like domain-containing protein [Delphinella strobiligena]|nr:kinase-like domain-containing protein [Delphinella strobiligena]
MPNHPLLDDTKYAREFDEFSMLGKGGYGVVFHVKHKLDGGSYAIKKIPMSAHRIRKIQQNGDLEFDNMLLELRTLARLNHPNVVRYHTGWIDNERPGTIEPCLALHIQMSLYSMTLADFLSPSDGNFDSSTISSLRHCFHPSAALSMILAIIDGVKYLHREGIVHRDLKPGNIFLAVRPGTDCPPGAFDVSSCTHCERLAERRPFNVDVCIGDFGLVSSIARPEDEAPATPSRIVGTEIYRPESVTRDNHPSLDFYALGVIAFELVWKFGTRMERHETLHKLKKGEFPNSFEEHVPDCPGLMGFIKSMLLASEEACPTWQSLKKDAVRLMADC